MKILRSLLKHLPFLSRRNPSVALHLTGIEAVRSGVNHLWHELAAEASHHSDVCDYRRAVKAHYGVLQALRVETHPDKTFVGPARKGFDFLGFHCCPTGVKVSDAALSRRETQVARHYEQGASKKRIAQYLVRWLGWAALAAVPTGAAAEIIVNTTNTNCHSLSQQSFRFTDNGTPTNIHIVAGDPPSTYIYLAYGADFPCIVSVRGAGQTINASPSTAGGTLSCTPASPEYNQSTTCTATPDTGYQAGFWGDDCGTDPATTPCTLTHVTSAKTVSATFTAIPNYVPTGPVSRIVVDPTIPTTLYSALDGGGVWKKIGAGDWTAATTQPTNLKVKDLVIAASGITLYAGTDGGGVFVSSDGCATWADMSNGLP